MPATHELIGEARAKGVDLLVFPELGLTGYLLQDLNAEVAMRADDPRLRRAGARRPATCRSSSASSRSRTTIGCSSPRRCSRTAPSATSTRKSYLPNYGLFDERRFFGAGDRVARGRLATSACAWASVICEDFWHLPVPYLLALDGAQVLVNISSSPGRDVRRRSRAAWARPTPGGR